MTNNQNMVQNPKVEVPSSIEMNDKDILTDILITEKNMTNNYSVALNELSNNYLYKKIMKIFCDTQEVQRRLFELMFKNGWYTLEKAPSNKINQKREEYNTMKQELIKEE